MTDLGGGLLLLRILVAPLQMAGYVGLTVLLFVPLVVLRWVFPRRSSPSIVRTDGDGPRHAGAGNRWDGAIRGV